MSKKGQPRRTHQYDMYKRFIRWASDRLDDDGIIAFRAQPRLFGYPTR